jgi:glycerate 2-kinase
VVMPDGTWFAGSLVEHGERRLRHSTLQIAAAGLDAADPGAALLSQVRLEGEQLVLPNRRLRLGQFENIWLVGAGKATGPLATALEEMLGDRLGGGVVVVPEGGATRTPSRLSWLEGEHPVPGERSFAAGRRLVELAGKVGRRDLVLSAVTGGSSALAAVPRDGIGEGEKQEMHRRLLVSGADITEVNTVRKHLSAIKGGRLAEAMHPACIVNFTVSDVAGDPVEYICDLTVQDQGRSSDAISVLEKYDLWEGAPRAVRDLLSVQPPGILPDLYGIDIETVMLVTGETVCRAMVRRAEALGVPAVVLGTGLSAPARAFGEVLASLAREIACRGRPFRPPIVLVACGGESTVALAGGALGEGGPNQEVALAAAAALAGCRGVVLFAMDTDGSDGGTTAAGGMVDGFSAEAALKRHVDIRQALSVHSSTRALNAIDDLIVTGRTQTNVNDLLVVMVDNGGDGQGAAWAAPWERAR